MSRWNENGLRGQEKISEPRNTLKTRKEDKEYD